MKIEQCFCGWQGSRDTMMQNGTPVCPVCRRQFSKFKCEGCGE